MGQAGSRCEREFDTKETLAVKLGCKNPVILSFVSPHCGLCRSLERDLCEIEESGVVVARIDSSKAETWAPELIGYDVETVPCFVLLDRKGRAVGRTIAPYSVDKMKKGIDLLLCRARVL